MGVSASPAMAATTAREPAPSNFAERRVGLCAAALLLVMGVAQFASAVLDSAIMDEGYHLLSGYRFLTTRTVQLWSEHPPLAQAIPAVPLLLLDLRLPAVPRTNEEEWAASQEFLFRNRYSAETILLVSRSMKLLVTLVLGGVLAWWTRRRFGAAAGLGALLLFAFDPNFLAHGHYVTTDVPASLGFLAGCLTWDAFLAKGNMRS